MFKETSILFFLYNNKCGTYSIVTWLETLKNIFNELNTINRANTDLSIICEYVELTLKSVYTN